MSGKRKLNLQVEILKEDLIEILEEDLNALIEWVQDLEDNFKNIKRILQDEENEKMSPQFIEKENKQKEKELKTPPLVASEEYSDRALQWATVVSLNHLPLEDAREIACWFEAAMKEARENQLITTIFHKPSYLATEEETWEAQLKAKEICEEEPKKSGERRLRNENE